MGLRWLADDLAASLRRLRRHPRNFLYPVLILAVGIGSTIGIFHVAYQALHSSLPYRHAGRIAVVGSDELSALLRNPYSYGPNPSLHTIFERSAAYYYDSANLVTGSRPQRIQIARVTPQFFSTLGVELMGPGFSTSIPEGPIPKIAWLPIVISDGLWRTYFGGDRGILYHSIELDIYPNHFQVVGIAPPGVNFPPGADAWMPTWMQSFSIFQSADLVSPSTGVIGLLQPGLSMAAAEARIRTWPRPSWLSAEDIKTILKGDRLISLPQFLGGKLYHLGIILWLATIFFLVLTIVAAMSIFQADLESRRQEFTIRSMLGATSRRLYGSLTLEIGFVLLSALIASLLVRYAVVRMTAAYLSLPGAIETNLSGIGLAMAAGAVMIAFAVTLIGQARTLVPHRQPVFSISRLLGSKPMKGDLKLHTISKPYLPVHIALATVILITAALLAHSAYNLMHIDPGLQPQNAFVCEIAFPSSFGESIMAKRIDPKLPRKQVMEEERAEWEKLSQLLSAHFALILERLRAHPDIASDGVISIAPYRGISAVDQDSYYSRTPWVPQPGQVPHDANIIHHTLVRPMSPGAIPALGMRLIYGRNFSVQGTAQSTVIINQALAEHLGRTSSALGQYVQIYPLEIQYVPPARIIGIVSNVHETNLYSPPQPTIYYPFSEWGQRNADIVVRTSRNISGQAVLPLIQASVQTIAPDATVSHFASMSNMVQSAGTWTRYSAYFLLALACLSIFLAGICAWSRSIGEINRRKHEIGIRMALGGTPGNIVQLIVIRGLKLTVIAALVGVLLAWWFSHLMTYLFYDVKLSDPISYIMGIITTIGFVFLVQTWSVKRAVQRNPSELMRAGLGMADGSAK